MHIYDYLITRLLFKKKNFFFFFWKLKLVTFGLQVQEEDKQTKPLVESVEDGPKKLPNESNK